MTDDNLTAILYKANDLRLEQTPIPEPGENEVLLRMAQVGICGSDVSYYTKGRCGDFIVHEPMIIGHEASGIVTKCGPGVNNLKPGDRVAIEPGVPCRLCAFCKNGKYNVCKEMKFCATPPIHGNLARYYKHAADFCFKLPAHVSMEEGAFLEPLSVGVHSCQRARIGLGSRVLITGAGPIGLLAMLTAKAMGASQVCMTDIQDNRLAIAKNLGADFVVNVMSKDAEQMAEEIADVMGDQPDATVECSGAEPSVRLAIFATKSGGTVVLVGVGASEITIPITNAAVREVDIRGIFRYANCYPTALRLIASGKVDVKPLITHRFPIEETLKAFETCRTGAGGAIKVMISC